MFFFSPMDIALLLPALALSLYAQARVQSAFRKMSQVRSASGMTGAEVAESLLRRNQLYDVAVEEVGGTLTDHYDPRSKTVRLSREVYRSNSLAALGVAAHETGHAIQHHVAYAPLSWRSALFPVVSFGSTAAFPLFFIGLIIPAFSFLIDVGIIFFAGVVLFHLVTLPVEFNASSRAMAQLSSGGYLSAAEVGGARKVLNAAALTYVAAAAMAILQLVRMLMIREND